MNNTMLTVRPKLGETVLKFVIIPNFENYKINELGEIYNIKTNKKLSTYIGIDNYEHCVLYKKGKRYRKRIHSLMGKAFLGNPQVVCHIDNNKSNNRLSNLKGATHKENIQDAYNDHLYKSTNNVAVIITDTTTGQVYKTKSMREAERITGVDRHRIKTFLTGSRNNYTKWDFKYNE